MLDATAQAYEKKVVAVFSGDFVNFSLLMGEDERDTFITLVKYRRIIAGEIERVGGRVVNMPGDSVLAEPPTATDAVKCALEIQLELARQNATRSLHRRLELRIGIEMADVLVSSGSIYGNGVNVAARLQSKANPGGIWVSDSVFDQSKTQLDISFGYIGRLWLKNIIGPVVAYRVEVGDGWQPAWRSDLQELSDLPFRGPSVAILNFRLLGGGSRTKFFAEMLSEDIVSTAASFRELVIVSNQSLQRLEDDNRLLVQKARELGIRYFLTGTVRQYARTVRVVIQLADAESARVLWAKHFDCHASDINLPQDVLPQKIVRAALYQLDRLEEQKALRSATRTGEAYTLLLRGQKLISQLTRGENRSARAILFEATRIDADYARAHVALSRSYTYDWSEDSDKSLSNGLKHAKMAVSLDELDARTHSELGFAHLWEKQHQLAIASYRKAVEINPYDMEIKVDLADALSYGGRPKSPLKS